MRLLARVTCVWVVAIAGCDRGGAPPTDRVFTFAAGSKVPGFVEGRGFGSVRDVDATGTLDPRVYALNDSIPGQTLRFPTGSRSDVRAIGDYANGVWTVSFERALTTSDPADVVFAPGGTHFFQVATFDDENGADEGRGMTATSLDVFSITLPATPGAITVPTLPANLTSLAGGTTATGLQLTATFRDRNNVRNDRPRPWVFDGTTWRRGSGDEDRLAFYWSTQEGVPLGVGPGTTGTGRCAEMCHTGIGERTLAGAVDSWEWSAGSTNPLGVALDGFVDATIALGRHADPGDGTIADNVDASGALPASEAADFPGVGSSSLIETRELSRRGVPFATSGPFSRGNTIPGFVNLAPTGSFADVRTRSSFKNGAWSLTMERSLHTPDPANDTQFDPGNTYFFQVATFDNEPGRAEAIGMTSQGDITYAMSLPATPGAIRFSSTPAKLSALTGVTTADTIRITATWPDANRRRNVSKGEWRFDGATWTRGPASEDEDGFGIYFAMQPNTNIGRGPGTTGTGRCIEMCHTGIAEWTAAGKLDAWRWAALRTDTTGTLEDTFVDSTVGGGRHPDAGDAGAILNDDGSGTFPAFAPEALAVDHADALVIGPSGTLLPPSWQPAIPFAQPIWTVTFSRTGRSADPTRDVSDFLGTHFFQVATFDNELGAVQDLPHTQYGTRTHSALVQGTSVPEAILFSKTPAGLTSIDGSYDSSNDRVSVRVRFRDLTGTANDLRNRWRFDGSAWARSGEGIDDMLAILWARDADTDLGTGPGTTGTGACDQMCHFDQGMSTLAGTVDLWQWSASRTNPAGAADDRFIDTTAVDGIKLDPGTVTYVANNAAGGSMPAFQSVADPDANRKFLFDLVAGTSRAVAFSGALSGFVAGDTIPGFVNRFVAGSRTDVEATASFDARRRRWHLDLKRRCQTPDGADVQLVAGQTYFFQVATRNRESAATADGRLSAAAGDEVIAMLLPTLDAFRGGATRVPLVFSRLPSALSAISGGLDVNGTRTDVDDDFIVMSLEWTEPAGGVADADAGRWTFDETRLVRGALDAEDGLDLLWSLTPGLPLGSGPGTNGTGTCREMCHGSTVSTLAGVVDAWSWSASRTGFAKTLDDGAWFPAGPRLDAGPSPYDANVTSDGLVPAFQAERDPGARARALFFLPAGSDRAVPLVNEIRVPRTQ